MKKFFRIDYQGTPRHVIEAADGGPWRLLEGEIFDRYEAGDAVARDAHRVLAPVMPSKIVCIGLNYKDHAAEVGKPLPKDPLMFIKPSTAVIGPGDPILLPAGVGGVDHEAEVGVVIGTRAHHVREADAAGFVFGLTCFNDVTARELQQKGAQYTHAKGFDTFAAIGPCVTAGIDYHQMAGVGIEGWVNGARRQNSSTKQLVFSIDYLIAYISAVMTLLPGDVIATGTPPGVGRLQAGDTVSIRIPGVGDLTNPVADESHATKPTRQGSRS
jgi:2-keto-4-pentenoate hydratase/2-oxohepta-3-ene-1,7-dioic acid hydratase in catechol pathway